MLVSQPSHVPGPASAYQRETGAAVIVLGAMASSNFYRRAGSYRWLTRSTEEKVERWL